jgi:hypothetical protein
VEERAVRANGSGQHVHNEECTFTPETHRQIFSTGIELQAQATVQVAVIQHGRGICDVGVLGGVTSDLVEVLAFLDCVHKSGLHEIGDGPALRRDKLRGCLEVARCRMQQAVTVGLGREHGVPFLKTFTRRFQGPHAITGAVVRGRKGEQMLH